MNKIRGSDGKNRQAPLFFYAAGEDIISKPG